MSNAVLVHSAEFWADHMQNGVFNALLLEQLAEQRAKLFSWFADSTFGSALSRTLKKVVFSAQLAKHLTEH